MGFLKRLQVRKTTKRIQLCLLGVMLLPAATLRAQYANTLAGKKPLIAIGGLGEALVSGFAEKWDSTWIEKPWEQAANGKWSVVVAADSILKGKWCRQCLTVYHTTKKGETLSSITRLYPNITTVAQLKAMNKLRSEQLVVGRKIRIGYIELPEDAEDDNSDVAGVEVWRTEKSLQNKPMVSVYEGPGIFVSEWKPAQPATTLDARIGCFKAESGWEDGKYYMLHNSLPAGSVVKLSNPANGKHIFVKIAGPLPNLKMNNELAGRICTAAGVQLGLSEDQVAVLQVAF